MIKILHNAMCIDIEKLISGQDPHLVTPLLGQESMKIVSFHSFSLEKLTTNVLGKGTLQKEPGARPKWMNLAFISKASGGIVQSNVQLKV